MVVTVSANSSEKTFLLTCTFGAGGSSGTVPKAALAALPDGPLSMAAMVRSDASVTAGKWSIAASAMTAALDGADHIYDYGLQLQ